MRRGLGYCTRAAASFFVLVILYGLLLAFPGPLFAHRIEEGPFVVYHTFVQERLGAVRTIRLPFWKKEGYAQYVALDFFSLDAGARALASPEKRPRLPGASPVPRHYLEAAVVWSHRMQIEGESFDEVIARTDPFPRLLEQALSAAKY